MTSKSDDKKKRNRYSGIFGTRTKIVMAFVFTIALVTAVVMANTYNDETDWSYSISSYEEMWYRDTLESGQARGLSFMPLSGTTHQITTPADMVAFLNGGAINGVATANNDEFVINGTINMAGQGNFQGRGFVDGEPFTGILRGENNATILNLNIIPRLAAEPATTLGHNDFGLIRVLGHNALIEDITFANVNYNDAAGLATWNNVEGSIGLVAGRIMLGSTVTMNNITLRGATAGSNATITFAGARETNNNRVGGLIGATEVGSTLYINNVYARLHVALNTTGTGTNVNRNVHTTGGLVGLAAGNVHIGGVTALNPNRVHLQTSIASSGNSRAFLHVGGVIGRLLSPTAGDSVSTIYRVHTTSGGTAVQINQSIGGFIGEATNVNISHSENHFTPTSTEVFNTSHHGGFIGVSRGIINFYRSHNHGNVFDTNGTAGGATITAGNNVGRGGFIGFMNLGSATFTHCTNHGYISTMNFGRLGGFVGRAVGAGTGAAGSTITFVNCTNYGTVRQRSTATGTGAEVRTRLGSAGGFVGYTTTSLHVTYALCDHTYVYDPDYEGSNDQGFRRLRFYSANHGHVRVHGRGGGGGIAGATSARGGTTTTLTRVHNHGTVYGQHTQNRYIGGMIGLSRNNITITNSQNHAIVRLTSSGADNAGTINRSNAVGGFIGMATGQVSISDSRNSANIINDGLNHRAGGRMRVAGFVGMATNRLSIENCHNTGDITSVRAGTGSTTAHHGAGGIVGRITFRGTRANRVATITNVTNTGIVNGTGRTGGIIGSTGHRIGVQGLTVSNALNTGDIRSWVVGGGIMGQSNSLNTRIQDAVNTGNVLVHNVGTPATSRGGLISAGGIVGRSSRSRVYITRTGNDATVTAISTNVSGSGRGRNGPNNVNTAGSGGIIGNIQRGTTNRITLSYNAGAIRGQMRGTGGIVGSIRRSGTTLIQDTYNVGLVYSTQAIVTGTAINSTNGVRPGNGILGHRRNIVGMVTMDRVFNGGNVSGHPIFRGTRGLASPRGDTLVGQVRRMTYRDVFFDTSIHTGHDIVQGALRFVPPTMHGVPTSILTSGGLAAFSGDNWRIRGWLDFFEADTDVRDTWETYPVLAWQIDYEETPRAFFQLIEPGADHALQVTSRTAYFWNVQGRSWAPDNGWGGQFTPPPPGGWGPTSGRPNFFAHPTPLADTLHDYMRTFNQYAPRAGSPLHTQATHPHPLAHPLRPAGSSTIPGVEPAHPPSTLIRRMSVGLVSPRGVVGFNGNELFDGLIIVGVDWYNRNEVVTWSRMYVDTAPPNGRLTNPPYTFYMGMLNLHADDAMPWEGDGCRPNYCLGHGGTEYCIGSGAGNINGHQIRLNALGYHDTWTCITIDQVSALGDGRVLVRVPMRRAPIENIVLTLHNDSASISDSQCLQPGIPTDRNPRGLSSRAAVNNGITGYLNLGNYAVPPWGRVQAAPRHQDLPAHSHFDISGSYWHDILTGMGRGFSVETLTLTHSAIENPHNEDPSPQNPFIVRINLRDIDLPDLPLRIVREFEHDDEDAEEAEIYLTIPHGGRGLATNNVAHYYFYSERANGTPYYRFRVELYNPHGVEHSSGALPRIIAGSASLSTAAVSTAAPASLADIMTPGNAASQQRSSGHWWVTGITEYTLVRVVPYTNRAITSPAGGSTNADGETSGHGGSITRSFRPSEWIPLMEVLEWSSDDDDDESDSGDDEGSEYPIRISVPIEYEHTRNVEVIEHHYIIEGQTHEHIIHIPNSRLHVVADVGLPAPEMREQPATPPNSGIFNNVSFLDGEEAEASAEGWSTEREVLNMLHPGDINETIFIRLRRNPLARIYGFTLCESMLTTPHILVVRPGTIVNAFCRESGVVIATTVSDSHGFFEMFLPPGTFPGSYLVIGTHPAFGFGTSIPSPVDIPAGADNARVNIFLGNPGYFPIFVRTLDMLGNNISNTCTAVLTYGMSTSPRTSSFDDPYKLIMARTADRTGANGWINGNISVSTNLGIPVGEVNIAQYLLDYPLRNPEAGVATSQRYQFLIITLRQGLPDWRRLNNAINATTNPPDRIIIHPYDANVPEIEMDGTTRIFNLVITDDGNGSTITTVPITTPNVDAGNPHRIRVARQVSVEAAPGANIVLRMPVAGFPNTPDEAPWNVGVVENIGRHFIVDTAAGNFTLGRAGSGSLTMDGNAVVLDAAVAGNRGGAHVLGSSTLNLHPGIHITNSRAVAGGGVIVSNGANLAMAGGTISRNHATYGGGIHATGVDSIVTMTAGTVGGALPIDRNIASSTVQGRGGGGIEIVESAALVINPANQADVLIANNYAHNNGGGINVQGGASRATIHNGIIRANSTRNTGAYGNGGGIAVNGGRLHIHNGLIEYNVGRFGGGLFTYGGFIHMSDGIIRRNAGQHQTATVHDHGGGGVAVYATSDGGAAGFYMHGGVIEENQSRQHPQNSAATATHAQAGGGVMVARATAYFQFYGGIIRNNTALHNGGGVALAEGASLIMGGNCACPSAVNCTRDYSQLTAQIYGNQALNATAGSGGGVWVGPAGGSFDLHRGTVGGLRPTGLEENDPNPHSNSAVFGGGVWVGTGASFVSHAGGTGRIVGNVATDGGGIWQNSGATVTISTGTAALSGIIDNRATNGGGIWVNTSASATITGNVLGNRATNGGGIFLAQGIGAAATVTGQLNNNIATTEGGGAYVSGGASLTVNGQIHQNTATRGGGVFVDGPRRPVGQMGEINSPGGAGYEAYMGTGDHLNEHLGDHMNDAPMYVGISPLSTNATFTIGANSTIYRNTAGTATVAGDGGGVWVAYGSTFTMNAVTINHNRAYGMGGAIFSERHDYNSPISRALAYSNLVWPGGSGINFSDNWTPTLQAPPINAAAIIPATSFGTTTPAAHNHVLNNWDVNFRATDYELTFAKIDDATNTALPGVVFYLYRFTGGSYVRVRGTGAPAPALVSSPTTGLVNAYLSQSRYRLVEVSVPHPFWVVPPAGAHWYIVVTGENAVVSRSNANAPAFRQSGAQLTEINPATNPIQNGVALTLHNHRITNTFRFHKTDHLIYNTQPEINLLPGADFRLFRTPIPINSEGQPDISGLPELITNSNISTVWEDVTPTGGLISTDDMQDYMSFDFVSGFVYQLVEQSAPDGYQCSESQWRVQFVNNDFVVTTMGSDLLHIINMRRLSVCTCTNTPCDRPVDFFVGNFPTIELPMSGRYGSSTYFVLGSVLLALAAVMMGAAYAVKKSRKLNVNYARTL